MKKIAINENEMFALSDKVILVREHESVIGWVSALGKTESDDLAYMFTFTGKLNNKDRQADVTVLMSIEDAFNLATTILDGVELLTREN